MPYVGELSALVTAILWSLSSVFFSEASFKLGSLQVNVDRLIFATIYLLLTILVLQLPLDLSFSQYFNLILSGIIGLIFGDSYLFKAFQHIGPRISMLIMSLAPAISALLAFIFLGEILPFWGITGIIITLFGVSLVILQRSEHNYSKYKISRSGILYAFFGAIGQAIGLIFAKEAFNEGAINGFVAAFIRIASSIIIFLPIVILMRKYKNPLRIISQSKSGFLYTTAGSIAGPYLGITLSLIAVANTKVGIAATIMATVPILMLPITKYFYKEELSWKSIIGAFITVAGIAILFLR